MELFEKKMLIIPLASKKFMAPLYIKQEFILMLSEF